MKPKSHILLSTPALKQSVNSSHTDIVFFHVGIVITHIDVVLSHIDDVIFRSAHISTLSFAGHIPDRIPDRCIILSSCGHHDHITSCHYAFKSNLRPYTMAYGNLYNKYTPRCKRCSTAGKGLPSSTFQPNLSCFWYKIHPKHPIIPLHTQKTPLEHTLYPP